MYRRHARRFKAQVEDRHKRTLTGGVRRFAVRPGAKEALVLLVTSCDLRLTSYELHVSYWLLVT